MSSSEDVGRGGSIALVSGPETRRVGPPVHTTRICFLDANGAVVLELNGRQIFLHGRLVEDDPWIGLALRCWLRNMDGDGQRWSGPPTHPSLDWEWRQAGSFVGRLFSAAATRWALLREAMGSHPDASGPTLSFQPGKPDGQIVFVTWTSILAKPLVLGAGQVQVQGKVLAAPVALEDAPSVVQAVRAWLHPAGATGRWSLAWALLRSA